jgi:radical SAM superfamily enzyme YgiQ (UPF0313 family)
MDILLIQPPIRDFYLTAKRSIPYGLAAITACLEGAGFSVGILDGLATSKSRPMAFPPEMSYLEEFYGLPDISPFCLFHGYRHFGYSYEHLEKQIRESGAFLVGISSLFTAYSEEAEKVAEIARTALPNAVIVVGGHHPTALPEDVMKWRPVDYAIRGEGESALVSLADLIRNGRNPSRVPGIVFRKPQGGIHISPPAVMDNLDAVPLPARHVVNNRFYTRGRSPSTVIVTSRGCPLRCSYCALGNGELYPYRQRSVSSVLCEIQDAVDNFGARFIDFEDENLSFSKKWFLSLLEGIIGKFGEGNLEFRAMNGLYPPTLDETVVEAMATAGFKILNLSLGSTCREQLQRFRRPDVRTAFDECLLLAEKNGLDAVGYVICGAPYQDAGQSLEDLLYLARRRVLAGLSVFYPAPGSKDFETASTLGILPGSHSLFRSSTIPLSHTTSRIQSLTLMRLSRIVNFMKQIIDDGKTIPPPARIIEKDISPPLDRFRMGEYLLSGFLADGAIRGLTPDHRIYRHLIDDRLAADFLLRLKTITIKGTGRH